MEMSYRQTGLCFLLQGLQMGLVVPCSPGPLQESRAAQGMHTLCWLWVPALILLAPKPCPAVGVNLILLGTNGVRNSTHLIPLCRWKPYGS